MSLKVESRTDSEFNFNLPENPTQTDWNNYIKDALEMLKIIPSDNYNDCPKTLPGTQLKSFKDMQIKAVTRFWDGVDNLVHTDMPIGKYIKKVLQISLTHIPSQNKYRDYCITISLNNNQDSLELPLAYMKALRLESPVLNSYFSDKIFIPECNGNTFMELITVCCSEKKIDVEKAHELLPLAIYLQMEKLEKRLIKIINEELTKIFEENFTFIKDSSDQFEEIVSFIMKLEEYFSGKRLPNAITEHLRTLYPDYILPDEALLRVNEIAQELPEDSSLYTELRFFLSMSLYDYLFKNPKNETIWETIQILQPSEMEVALSFDDLNYILNISSLKKLEFSGFGLIELIDHVKDLTPNPSITELCINFDDNPSKEVLDGFKNDLPGFKTLFPNLQVFRIRLGAEVDGINQYIAEIFPFNLKVIIEICDL